MVRSLQGFALSVIILAAIWIPKQSPAQTAASSFPDILGVRTGMPPGDAYNLLKAHDPAHTVALEQATYPQLYGTMPITFGMNTATSAADDQFSIEITLPPNPQVVWRIHRALGPFPSNTQNVLNSVFQKYGTPWNPNVPAPFDPHSGVFHWFFDQQGRRAEINTQAGALTLKNCLNTGLQPWFGDDVPITQQDTSTRVVGSFTRTMPVTIPPMVDPSKNSPCNNLIVVQVTVNGGMLYDNATSFMIDFLIADYTVQHVAEVALDNQLNAIVLHGVQQQRNAAAQQAVPKF
jgi:hypothetical protein